MPDEVRIYAVSGVPHAPFRPLTKPVMQLPGNPLGYGAFMRALLVALFEWVEHGIAPPDSRFPSRAAGTLVPLAEARADIPPAAGGELPDRAERAAAARPFGRAAEREHGLSGVRAIDRMPTATLSAASATRCSTAPLATHVGWSLRASGLWRGRPVHHSRFDDPVRRRPKPSGSAPTIRGPRSKRAMPRAMPGPRD